RAESGNSRPKAARTSALPDGRSIRSPTQGVASSRPRRQRQRRRRHRSALLGEGEEEHHERQRPLGGKVPFVDPVPVILIPYRHEDAPRPALAAPYAVLYL